ncbi:ANTAR domain-containing protein [Arthrobacter sp. JSM 101049]|uniref:ANTAR domain-containing protein n=1 Tax=Arthrobacter sp. JSM 101049 TaxID=929097 RepID=UPI0035660E63
MALETLESANYPDPSLWGHIHALLLEESDLTDFLNELARHAAASFPHDGAQILAGITLLRGRKAATVASSSERARRLDEIQYDFGDGPCLTAAREHQLVSVPDVGAECRWPEFSQALLREGIHSVLGVPFELGADGQAALNLYSTTSHCFGEDTLAEVQAYVAQSSKALRMGMRFSHYVDSAADLRAALESRTTIDIAIGIIMAENRCPQAEAFEILRAASSSRNSKLREVAAEIVRAIGQPDPSTHFDA